MEEEKEGKEEQKVGRREKRARKGKKGEKSRKQEKREGKTKGSLFVLLFAVNITFFMFILLIKYAEE